MRQAQASHATDEFVVLDFETTGRSPGADRVIEIAAIRYRGAQPAQVYATLVDPGITVPAFIQQLTGISGRMLAGQPDPLTAFHGLMGFIGAAPVVAHNASFDRGFLTAELRLTRLPQPVPAFACTLKLARRAWPQLRSHSLGNLATSLALPATYPLHRAEADARLTGHLWARMQQRFAELGQPADTAALHRAGALAPARA